MFVLSLVNDETEENEDEGADALEKEYGNVIALVPYNWNELKVSWVLLMVMQKELRLDWYLQVCHGVV